MTKVSALTISLAAFCTAPAAQESVIVRTTIVDAAYPGSVVPLSITCRCDAEHASASIFKHDVPLARTANGWQGWIGIDLDTKPGTYPIRVSIDASGTPAIAAAQTLIVKPKQFPVRRLNVAPQFVDPPAGEVERIQREAAALQTIFNAVSRPQLWRGPIQPPLNVEPSSNFGSRSVFNGQARSPHAGIDFGAKIGTPIAAPADGVVVLAEPLYFTGNTVVIDHGLGLYSLLAHLSEFKVKKEDRIGRGDVVGLVGDTGRVTGAHLHWTVRLNGARVDPLSLIAATKN